MDHFSISKGLFWNREKLFCLLLFFTGIILFSYTFLEYVEADPNTGLNKKTWLFFWIISIIFLYFNYDESQLFTSLLICVFLFPFSIAYPIYRYLSLAAFIAFQPTKIVIRHRFTIYYIPHQSIKDIVIYTPMGQWAMIYFKIDTSNAVILNMRFLRPFTKKR